MKNEIRGANATLSVSSRGGRTFKFQLKMDDDEIMTFDLSITLDADCKIDGDVEVHETEEEALLAAPTR